MVTDVVGNAAAGLELVAVFRVVDGVGFEVRREVVAELAAEGWGEGPAVAAFQVVDVGVERVLVGVVGLPLQGRAQADLAGAVSEVLVAVVEGDLAERGPAEVARLARAGGCPFEGDAAVTVACRVAARAVP